MAALITKAELKEKIEQLHQDLALMPDGVKYCPVCNTYQSGKEWSCWCDYESRDFDCDCGG